MEIKSTAKPTPAMKTLAFITMRDTKSRESVIKGKYFTIKEECDNNYNRERMSVLPSGTVIQADFGGDFGLYAIADINGILRKVKIELHELHKIDFGEIPDDVIEQAEKAWKEIQETGSVYDEE